MSDAFKKLNAINVNEHTEKKGQLTYLSWSWAWATLVESYPDADYEFGDNEIHPDGSVTVYCTVTVNGKGRTMWLPVMDNRNKAVQNPDARAISDARMRCLVKAIAMHGLGLYIYAGEDIPAGQEPRDQTPATYSQEAFTKNFPVWQGLVQAGKASPSDIIAKLNSVATLTDEQVAAIKSLQDEVA